ncbi:MAG TPA: HU family DNA-binding protein [Aquella sp.]|nr:HU family DNA-binding protein [Aquella sp.]
MNRSEIIATMAELYPKLVHKEIDSVVKQLLNLISDNIASGKRIEIRGFGAFSLKERRAGLIRNPRLGVSMESDGRYVVYFRAGKELKDRVNTLAK